MIADTGATEIDDHLIRVFLWCELVVKTLDRTEKQLPAQIVDLSPLGIDILDRVDSFRALPGKTSADTITPTATATARSEMTVTPETRIRTRASLRGIL